MLFGIHKIIFKSYPIPTPSNVITDCFKAVDLFEFPFVSLNVYAIAIVLKVNGHTSMFFLPFYKGE